MLSSSAQYCRPLPGLAAPKATWSHFVATRSHGSWPQATCSSQVVWHDLAARLPVLHHAAVLGAAGSCTGMAALRLPCRGPSHQRSQTGILPNATRCLLGLQLVPRGDCRPDCAVGWSEVLMQFAQGRHSNTHLQEAVRSHAGALE